MQVSSIIPQLRTTDIDASIRFYTERLGFTLDFRYEDFYAGIRAGTQLFHLKRVDSPDPSVAFVRAGGHFHLYLATSDADAAARAAHEAGITLLEPLHDTPWGTREFAFADDHGHVLYVGEVLARSTP